MIERFFNKFLLISELMNVFKLPEYREMSAGGSAKTQAEAKGHHSPHGFGTQGQRACSDKHCRLQGSSTPATA